MTTGRGKGDNKQPTFFSYNPPFNPSRTEHILMSTAFLCAANKSACYMNLTQQIIEPVSCQCSLPHIDLRLPSQVRRNGKGKHMVWRDEHKDAFVSHMLENETVLQSFRNSIRNQEHQSCYKHFLDLNTLAATGMTTRRMSRRMQLGLPMAPWYDATCRDYKRRIRWNKKHNQPFAELQQHYSTCSTAG